MKEWFLKSASFVLPAVCAGMWAAALLFDDKLALNAILIFCILSQLLLFLFCGIIMQKLHRQANIDSLTGICNRRSFFIRMPVVLKTKLPVAVMMLDIDNFKKINDTYGHAAGDAVLKRFAEILKSNTRSTDIVARLGGEEFAVVLPGAVSENAFKTAERIKRAVETEDFTFGSVTDKITISIGISTTKRPIHPDRLLEHADRALYKAKETKNAIVVNKECDRRL